ncbi:hypothetical protein E8E12_011539 [Didymella heteroderae]|uniref:Uncharacterized protein n=1 Tax=Didymella heteroderae TaxID=1769908 RepID=A0A9P4X160_9PLEO|nr:hypothetical protein E8E12_011539 [Didymella heteroderae]
MQTSAPDREETPPFTTPDASVDEQQPGSHAPPDAAEISSGRIDTLVAKAAKRIADVINDFKRELDTRHGTWAHVQGTVELALKFGGSPNIFTLTITPDEDGDEYPVTVKAALKKPEVITIDNAALSAQPIFKPTRRASDAELEEDIVSRKKRKLDNGEDRTNKRPRTGSEENEPDTVPLIPKEDLDDLLFKLREDIQEDTIETVNHVQRLLRRFKDEWHEQTKRDFENPQKLQPGGSFRNSISAAGAGPGVSFPSSADDRDDVNASIAEVVRREAELLSRQIKWVEDCRRVANDVHVKREDTWRTSSAGFHDQQRQDRENFQNRMVHESAMHSQTLNQILNEVKAIGLYAQSMKWETPSYLNHMPNALPQVPTPPAFPTQPAPPAFPTQTPRPSRTPSSGSTHPVQQHKHFTWKTGRGPGTQNG